MDEDDNVIDLSVLRKTVEVNLIGTVSFTNRMLSAMSDGGSIISISSGAGSLSVDEGTYAPSYSISKTAINMMTRKFAALLASRYITVSSIDPGWVRTDMGGEEAPRDPSEVAQEIFAVATAKDIPLGMFWHRGKVRSW